MLLVCKTVIYKRLMGFNERREVPMPSTRKNSCVFMLCAAGPGIVDFILSQPSTFKTPLTRPRRAKRNSFDILSNPPPSTRHSPTLSKDPYFLSYVTNIFQRPASIFSPVCVCGRCAFLLLFLPSTLACEDSTWNSDRRGRLHGRMRRKSFVGFATVELVWDL